MPKGKVRIKKIKEEKQRDHYLVGIEDTKEASQTLIGFLKEQNIQFTSMKVLCLVEKGAKHNVVDWKMPFAGTLIKVNFQNR